MKDILAFMNQNQGAIIALLTAIMVVVNIFLWRANHKQLKQLKKQWKESQNPHLSVGIVSIGQVIYLEVVNIGYSTAVKTKFTFDAEILKKQDHPQCNDNKKYLEELSFYGINVIKTRPIYIPTFLKYADFPENDVKILVRYQDIMGETFGPYDITLNKRSYLELEYQDDLEKQKSKSRLSIAYSLEELLKTVNKQS